jgi:3-methyladenine DNA glycosylase Tag
MDGKAPPQHRPTDLAGYLEALSRPVFQAGISWRVIDSKWEGIREAFSGFDPPTVTDYAQDDVDTLLADPRVVRSKAKIEATVDNAQALIELDIEHGGFGRYLRSHAGFEETVADLKRQFRFIGDSGAYHFLWSVDEPTPLTREVVRPDATPSACAAAKASEQITVQEQERQLTWLS